MSSTAVVLIVAAGTGLVGFVIGTGVGTAVRDRLQRDVNGLSVTVGKLRRDNQSLRERTAVLEARCAQADDARKAAEIVAFGVDR